MQISQDHTMQPEVHCFEVVLFFFLPHLLDCNFLYWSIAVGLEPIEIETLNSYW